MKEKYSSIKIKLLRIILVTSGVVLFLTCSAFFAYEWYAFRQTTKEHLSTLGRIIAANSTAALAFQSHEDANDILLDLRAETHVVAACLYDVDGNMFARYPVTSAKSGFPRVPSGDGYQYVNAYLEGFEPVIQKNRRLGTLYIQSDLKAITARFTLYAMITFLVMLITFCVAYLLSNRLQKSVSDPILALADTAGRVSNEQDYTVRARKFHNDEVGELTEAFNQMLSQIEKQNAEITTFTHALEAKVNERTHELELANSELKLKNEFVETIIDSSINVIAVFDKNLNYVMLNRYGQKAYHVHAKDVIGKNILDVFPKIKGSQMFDDLTNALHGNEIHNPYYRSRISDKVLENFYIPLLDKDGAVYSVLVIGHDITEIVNVTEKLSTLNNELAKSNRDLEQFAYVASHDLQEPLRKIQTFSSILEKKIGDKDATVTYLAKIISSVGRMGDLIKAILNYSQASNQNGKFEMVDLNEIVENIKVDFELSIADKGAEITCEELPVIDGDKLQLSQLFLNLIGNSLKFSQRKPEIIIRSSIVEENELKAHDSLTANGRYAKIEFTDNGIGFDQQYASQIFTIFQRLHSRQEYAGTGIGLALCKKIVENHKGHISVSSKPGEGSTFEIYLPLRFSRNFPA